MRGIEPRAFHMQSERSTTELHPLSWLWSEKCGNLQTVKVGPKLRCLTTTICKLKYFVKRTKKIINLLILRCRYVFVGEPGDDELESFEDHGYFC